jgi:sortase A
VKPPAGNRGFGNDPLLRVGTIAMAFALVLALVAAVLTILLRGSPERAVASETDTIAKSSAGPLVGGESPVEPWREQERHMPTPGGSEANPGSSGGEQKPALAPAPKGEAGSQPQQEAQAEPKAQPESKSRRTTLPVGESGWTRPTRQEIQAANRPRHYTMPAGAIMSITIPSMGIYGAPVFDSVSPMALAKGVAHLPDTSLPWSPTPQRNVYLAGHRMGFRGTWSRMLFYNLDKLREGDKIVLRDRAGQTYKYRVSEYFIADPAERWVTGQIRGRDMLTLQTCTPIPTFEKRLIVRADRL